jgi:hypothetical protein
MTVFEADTIYHRAIWALDAKHERRNEQYWLMLQRRGVARMEAVDGIDPSMLAGEIDSFVDNCARMVGAHESDRQRPDWQKARDYLLCVVARCLKAAKVRLPTSPPVGWKERFFNFFRKSALASPLSPQEAAFMVEVCSVLHYYSPSNEDFHADLGIGYILWQAMRAELKQGITLANLSDDSHHELRQLGDAIRNVIAALEHGDHTRLPRYEKSALDLSEEQHRQRLWEGVVTELTWILRDNGKGMSARMLA